MLIKHKAVLFAIAVTSVLGSTLAAKAVVLQISATAMVLRPAAPTDESGGEQAGMLTDTQGRYFAAVMFPTTGDRVCRFAVVYRDNDANDITARLMKKPLALGQPTAFDPPVTMAEVSSSGASMNTRRTRTTNITEPVVNTTRNFYFVELEVPDGTNIEVLGFQIFYRESC